MKLLLDLFREGTNGNENTQNQDQKRLLQVMIDNARHPLLRDILVRIGIETGELQVMIL